MQKSNASSEKPKPRLGTYDERSHRRHASGCDQEPRPSIGNSLSRSPRTLPFSSKGFPAAVSIRSAFDAAASEDRCAFVPFLTGGFPDHAACVEILSALAGLGADVIEVGLPSSDAPADGPTIRSANRMALAAGATVESVFRVVEETKRVATSPFVLMTYVDPVRRIGFQAFARGACGAGVSGVIIPDLSPEDEDKWMDASQAAGLDCIFLVGSSASPERMKRVASLSRGFLYYMSTTGVTGGALNLSDELIAGIRSAKTVCDLPVAVGFGIATPDDARALAGVADGVIVGSALIRAIDARASVSGQIRAAATLSSAIIKALARDSSENSKVTGVNDYDTADR